MFHIARLCFVCCLPQPFCASSPTLSLPFSLPRWCQCPRPLLMGRDNLPLTSSSSHRLLLLNNMLRIKPRCRNRLSIQWLTRRRSRHSQE